MDTRQLNRQDSDIEFQRHVPGCVWSILHVLDYHYWHNSRKIPPRIRNRRAKPAICCGYPKTISFQHYDDDLQSYLDADAVPLLEQQTPEDIPSKHIPGKTRINASSDKEISESSELKQAVSISRLEHSDGHGRITSDWPKPIIILDRNSDTAVSRLHVPSLSKGSDGLMSGTGDRLVSNSLNHSFSEVFELGREISHGQFTECVDVLEMFKMDKEFHARLTSDKKLRKSGSFPLAVSPHKIFKPVTLDHKWNETWSFPKGERLVPSMADNLTGSKAGDDGKAVANTSESDLSSSGFIQGSTKHGWHLSFMRHLKGAMKKIKHTNKWSNKKNHTSISTLLPGVPSKSNHDDRSPEVSEEVTVFQDDCHEGNSSDADVIKVQPSQMRRGSSLNESMDRYARLFEYSMIRETKWHEYQSKSLRLTNEDKLPEMGSGLNLKSYRRRLSLPDLDCFSLLTTEASNDDINGKKISCSDLKSVRDDLQDFVEETELHDNIAEERKSCTNDGNSGVFTESLEIKIDSIENFQEDISEQEKHGNNPCEDQEISPVTNSGIEPESRSPVSVLQTHSQHDTAEQTMLPLSKDPSVDMQVSSSRNSCTVADHENAGNTQTKVNNNVLHLELNDLDDADFNYVRDVLGMSGIIDQGYLGTWHSIDQPLSPTLFKELDAYLHQDSECISEEAGNKCDHQLLFDLINEILLQIYASLLAYFPKSFSFTRLCPPPKRNHVVEEVWKRISWCRNTRSKTDQSLDDIITQDLAKDDSRMNLQLDVEDTVLDLEDLIFEELMDEVITCL